jgi:hypothetical protein
VRAPATIGRGLALKVPDQMHKEHAMRPAHLMFAIAYATVALVVIFAHSGTAVRGAGAQRTAGGEQSAGAAVTVVRRFDK